MYLLSEMSLLPQAVGDEKDEDLAPHYMGNEYSRSYWSPSTKRRRLGHFLEARVGRVQAQRANTRYDEPPCDVNKDSVGFRGMVSMWDFYRRTLKLITTGRRDEWDSPLPLEVEKLLWEESEDEEM